MQKDLKLPRAFKKKWIAALRSGKYKQAQGTLYSADKDGYCCLGVACIVTGVPKDTIYGGYITRTQTDKAKTKIPKILLNDTAESEGGLSLGFGALNDSYKWNFDEIAEFVEHAL